MNDQVKETPVQPLRLALHLNADGLLLYDEETGRAISADSIAREPFDIELDVDPEEEFPSVTLKLYLVKIGDTSWEMMGRSGEPSRVALMTLLEACPVLKSYVLQVYSADHLSAEEIRIIDAHRKEKEQQKQRLLFDALPDQ